MRMPWRAIGLIAAVVVGWSCGDDSPTNDPVSFRDLVQLQRPTDIELSPDGQHLAFIVHRADLDANVPRLELILMPAAGGTERRVSASGDLVSAVRWAPKGNLLAFAASNDAGSRIEILDSTGVSVRVIPVSGQISSLAWAPDASRIAFTAPASDPALPQLWVADLSTGEAHPFFDEKAAVQDPQWSPDGKFIAYVRLPGDVPDAQFYPSIVLFDVTTGTSRTLTDPNEYVSSPRFSPDGSRLAYLGHPANDDKHRALAFDHLEVLSLSGGAPRILAPGFTGAQRRPAWSADGQTLFFESFTHETAQLFSVSAGGGDAVALTHVPGVAYLASYSASSVAALVEDPRTPPEIYVSALPPAALTLTRVSDLNPALRQVPVGTYQVVHWTSTDGLEVTGVLLLPEGFQRGHPVPTLVVSHGGPATLVVLSYNDSYSLSAAPAWTSNGWAVFYPNYRGSTNRDEAFAMAEVGQVGRGDFDDVMTGIDALVRDGIADPNRLAHSGWSFGGYLGGWANTHTTRFKAISAGAGPYDWVNTYAAGGDQFPLRVYLEGSPETNPQRYHEASVSTWVNQAKTPTTLFGAQDDDLVPASDPQAFHDALQARGVPTEVRIFEGEPHELQLPRNQLEKLERERDWILKYVGPTPTNR